MSEVIRVDMTGGKVKRESLPEKYMMFGGRALTSQIVADEVIPTCHPLSVDNKLVIAPGLLSGTSCPSSGRLSVGGKSPLTGGIKEANAGGITSQKLANLKVRAIVVEGKPAGGKFFLLKIAPDGEELLPADDLAGKGTYEVTSVLREKYGEKVGVITIGLAGEMLMYSAGVATNDGDGNSSRYAGRGGLGAVMGAKGLKVLLWTVRKPLMYRLRRKKSLRLLP